MHKSNGLPDGSFDLTGKRVLVTGAGRGIGAAIATILAGAGAHTFIHYRKSGAEAESVAADIHKNGGSAALIQADVTESEDVARMVEEIEAQGGALDILVNNVGAYPNADLLDMTQEEWRDMFSANMDTVFLCTRHAARGMKEKGQGAIVNIGSIAGSIPGPAHSHYNSAKAAVDMFTRSAAQELGPYGIRVNCVAPGLIGRPGLEEAWPEGVRSWQEKAPLTRVGTPQDVASACLFLASDAASFITGHILAVDGGMGAAAIY